MSRGANMSILGMYQYDNTIFDLMHFPDEFTTEQKETVINNILAECAEVEFLYPAATVAKNIIGIWSAKELPYWNRVYNAALLEYNPIENYRRNENETIHDLNAEQHSGSDINSSTGSATTAELNSGTDTTLHKISGYDSNTLVDNSSDATTYGSRVDGTESANSSNTLAHGERIDYDNSRQRAVLAYGNIGVTTSQQMLTQEIEVAKLVNVMNIITESFKDRFCLMVY